MVGGFLQSIVALKVDELPALLFQGNLGVELVFFDLSLLLLHRRGAPGGDSHIGFSQEGLAIFGFQSLGNLGRRLGCDEVNAQQVGAERIEQGRVLDPLQDPTGHGLVLSEDLFERPLLDFATGFHLDDVRDSLRQAVRVVRNVRMRQWVHGVVQKFGRPLGIVNPVGELALDGHSLETAGDLVEDEVGIHAAGRNHDDLGLVLGIEKRQPLAFTGNLP